jgi:hypothetical protein
MVDQPRYGVFLRPDPLTSAAVSTVAALVRAQYGFVSAGAFPPHVTLAGSLPIAVSEQELIDRLGRRLNLVPPFEVENNGVRRLPVSSVVYGVHELGGVPNVALVMLAALVEDVISPLLRSAPGLPADRFRPERWSGHLSLASHELLERDDLRDEVEEFIRGLDVTPPTRWRADVVTLYRLTHPDWTGPWWETFRWQHVRSWRLRDQPV